MSEPAREGARPADDTLRELGLQLVQRLLAVIRIGRSYKVGNQVFARQLEGFREALEPVLRDCHEAVLVTLDHDLYLNGVRIPLRASNVRFQQALNNELARRHIAGMRFEQGVTSDELERFFALFMQPDSYVGPALLEACLADGVSGVLPAVHASTDDSGIGDPFDPTDQPAWSEGDGSGAGMEGGSGAGGSGGGGNGSGGVGHGSGDGMRSAGGGAGRTSDMRAQAHRGFSLALHGARSVLTTTSLQDGVEMRHAKRVVQPLIDGAFQSEPVVVGLATLSHHDEYTYAHAVNVCMVAVTMGHWLGLDRRALADLGVAALLHDTGKAAVHEHVKHPFEQFDDDDRRAAERHAVEGAKLIARSTTLSLTTLRCMRVALEHHAGPGGYPALPEGWETSLLSRIVGCADAYVSLQMHRSARGPEVTPYEALGMMLGPLAPRFDPAALWALVQSVGYYPPGQMVELADRRIAVVLAPNADDPSRPSVRVVMDECGVPFAPVEAKEYCPMPASMQILRALAAREYPTVPTARAA
jgi:HD-GYP domain-containing protein (c-di-GMP phosphodiesterase class II)